MASCCCYFIALSAANLRILAVAKKQHHVVRTSVAVDSHGNVIDVPNDLSGGNSSGSEIDVQHASRDGNSSGGLVAAVPPTSLPTATVLLTTGPAQVVNLQTTLAADSLPVPTLAAPTLAATIGTSIAPSNIGESANQEGASPDRNIEPRFLVVLFACVMFLCTFALLYLPGAIPARAARPSRFQTGMARPIQHVAATPDRFRFQFPWNFQVQDSGTESDVSTASSPLPVASKLRHQAT